MPLVSTEGNGQYWEPVATGPVAQNYPPVSAPASLAANATYVAGPYRSDGFKVLTAAVELSGAGSLIVQRYIDLQGQIPQGAPTTLPLTANTLGVVNLSDGLPFGSFEVTVTAGGAVVNLSDFIILQTAQ